MAEAQETTTANDLTSSLGELEALAGGLEKAYGGVSIANSGTTGSDGKQGGGQPGASDVGGIDTLQIGKMVDLGVVQPTAALVGYMGDDSGAYGTGRMAGYMDGYQHGKAGKDMDTGDGKGEEYMDGYKKGYLAGHGTPASKSLDDEGEDTLTKSSFESLLERPGVGEALDASAFLEELTKGVADSLDELRKSQTARNRSQDQVNQGLIKSNIAMAKALKMVEPVINALGERLELVERTPNPPRGATTTGQARALAKSVPGELGDGGAPKLSKAEVVNTLSYMNLEKGVKQINGQATSRLVAYAEAGDLIDEPTMTQVSKFLQQNPEEAERAKAYH